MKLNQAYEKTELNNGLKVISYKMPNRQTAAIGVWIGVGGRYENKSNKGISHFLEHLLFKGSKKYSNRQIKESIEGVGGMLNAFTSEELTCYLSKVPAKHLYLTLDILSDMVINPLFNKKDIEKEKTVVIEEIKMYKDLPQHYVQELLDEMLWPNHPLGMNIAGSIKNVSAITREGMIKFKDRFYSPSNIVIACCGNVDHNKFVDRIKKIYPKDFSKNKTEFKAASGSQRKLQINLFSKDIEQTHFSLGMNALRRDHPDRYILALLNVILGANMSSRLFHEVREKRGLAYAIGTHIRRFYDTGAFLIQAGVDNKRAVEAIKIVLLELEKISKNPVTNKELSCAKEYLIGQLFMSLEDTMDHMFWIGEQIKTKDKIDSFEGILKDINKINRDDLLRIARKIFKKENMRLALVGPNTERDKKVIKKLLS